MRKFFGVPDGAYLYSTKNLKQKFVKDQSSDRCSHLLKRLDNNLEKGYIDYANHEIGFKDQDIKEMSDLTTTILSSLDYTAIAFKRTQNFKFLHDALQKSNRLEFNISNINTPMVYPYWSHDKLLRERLLSNNIYTATYWRNVKQWIDKDSLEYQFVDEIVYLPVDQRYDNDSLLTVLNLIVK